jgi:hypothetical protein
VTATVIWLLRLEIQLLVTVYHQLATEIKDQLNDDILYFGWMVQIARLQNPDRTESDNVNAVLDSVSDLHREGKIVVGNAHNQNDMVLIEPWPETAQGLRTRMVSAIDTSDVDDRAFCFWIQLTEHFAI